MTRMQARESVTLAEQKQSEPQNPGNMLETRTVSQTIHLFSCSVLPVCLRSSGTPVSVRMV